jgi:putative toxin-antitoxin system antitoxin component (TIGR02293 family)
VSYQRGARPDAAHRRKTERLARLFVMAESIWGDEGEARRFMNTPHAELDGRTPVQLATPELGARHVEEVIERGRHGLPV